MGKCREFLEIDVPGNVLGKPNAHKCRFLLSKGS